MSPTGRRRSCTRAEGRVRAAQARAYLETAKLVRSEQAKPEDVNFNHVAAGTAVLAAIAAADAICCALLGERSRGQDHREAVPLLESVRFGDGTPAAQARSARDLGRALAVALDLKDDAHYGTYLVGAAEVQRLLRAAERLVAAAEAVV